MLKNLILTLSIVLFSAVSIFTQTVNSPSKGSAERAAILNALRVPVEKELKQKIQFSVNTMKTQGVWAFVNGEPQTATGGQPNYKNTVYQDAIENGAFDNNFQALLKKSGGKWKVITYAVGCTDVCWLGWDEQFKAPKAIFPNAE